MERVELDKDLVVDIPTIMGHLNLDFVQRYGMTMFFGEMCPSQTPIKGT